MRGYIFGCILISLIGGIALHISHTSLREPARISIGIATLLFVSAPFLYLLGGAYEIDLPSPNLSAIWGEEIFDSESKDAYIHGVRLALADKYNTDADCFIVTADGFELETLYVTRLSVTLTGRAALLDYRAVSEYLKNNLNIGECRVNVDIG